MSETLLAKDKKRLPAMFAATYPERTSALVLLSSAPYTPLTVADREADESRAV